MSICQQIASKVGKTLDILATDKSLLKYISIVQRLITTHLHNLVVNVKIFITIFFRNIDKFIKCVAKM